MAKKTKPVSEAITTPDEPTVEKTEIVQEKETPRFKELVIPDTLNQEQMDIAIQALAKDRGIVIDLNKPWYDESNVFAFQSLTIYVHGLVYSLVPDYSIQPEATQNHLRGRFASM